MTRFIKSRMSKPDLKMIEMAVRLALPDTLSYTQKCRLLEKLADEYRAKSRKEVSDAVDKFKSKR